MKESKVLSIVLSAVIASLYVVLTIFAASFDLASGAIQVRLSEAFTIFPFFTPVGIYGVTLGCFISNIVTGANIFDIIFGTFATLIGSIGTWYLGVLFRKTKKIQFKFLAPLPPIVANTLIIPYVLVHTYGLPDAIPFLMLTVGIGEVIACGIFGMMLMIALKPIQDVLFGNNHPS